MKLKIAVKVAQVGGYPRSIWPDDVVCGDANDIETFAKIIRDEVNDSEIKKRHPNTKFGYVVKTLDLDFTRVNWVGCTADKRQA